MSNNVNNILKSLITNVVQRPEWDQSGREQQTVTAFFTTPSGFTGSVKMTGREWSDAQTRFGKVIEAVKALDFIFAEEIEVTSSEED